MTASQPDRPPFAIRLLRFSLVGGGTSLGYLLVVAALVEQLGLGPGVAAGIAYAVMLPLNFFGHRRVTYASNARVRREILRFGGMYGAAALVCAATMSVTTGTFGWSHWVGSLVIIGLVPTLNLFLLELWVFRPERPHWERRCKIRPR